MDEATLHARFLPPYQAAIAAGAQSIMVSFSSWHGTKLHAHPYLLTDLRRRYRNVREACCVASACGSAELTVEATALSIVEGQPNGA